MLRDSANHLPTIIDNLLRVIYHLGEQNVFFSIYESGSSDDGHTTAMIETIKVTFEAIGIEHHIRVEGASDANARDIVLRPLKEMYQASERVFNTVVMMGDDLWCAEEFLELLFHSRGQAASITCSTDVRANVSHIHDPSNFRAISFLFPQDTMSQGNSSSRVRSAPTSKTPTQHLVSARIIPSEFNPVSPPSQSLIQLPFTHPTTSSSPPPPPTQTIPPPSGTLNAGSLLN